LVRRLAEDRTPGEVNLPRRCRQQSGQGLEAGGLAGTVGTDQRHSLAFADV